MLFLKEKQSTIMSKYANFQCLYLKKIFEKKKRMKRNIGTSISISVLKAALFGPDELIDVYCYILGRKILLMFVYAHNLYRHSFDF